MKFFAILIALFSVSAIAETVINYDDGSTLTLTEGENVYVVKGKLYQQRSYQNGKTIQFKVIPPTKRRDYVPQPQDPFAPGSHEWCAAYVPWSEGYTFGMQTWQRHCDTNSDGVYDMCDYYEPTGAATFEEIEWQDKCNDGKPWDGS